MRSNRKQPRLPVPPKGARRKALLAKRDAWLRDIDPSHLFHRLLDFIPGVFFFAKNREGELMFLGQSNRELHNLAHEADVIGLTDFDLSPTEMARSFVQDDSRIYATGKPILNHVELWFDRLGIPDWFIVNKMPIRSRTGEIIGIMGFSQTFEGRTQLLQSTHSLSQAIKHIRQNYSRPISISELATMANLSTRQLQRKFKDAYGVGPHQFIIKTRLVAACHALLDSEQRIADIAYQCGFSDQSAFARDFRRYLGMTPKQFRLRGIQG